MKKLTSLFLSLLMILSLAGCGDGTEELAGAVLDAAIDAVENYESTDDSEFTPSDSDEIGVIGGADGPTSIVVTEPDDTEVESPVTEDPEVEEIVTSYIPEEGEYYYDLENVVLYIEYYGELPDNYITKDEARELGWKGGVPEYCMEGAAIGGDRFGNREGKLPKGNYTECDLNTLGEDERGAERLVFSDDEYYYTEDHYENFTQVWVENGEVIYE